MLFKSGYFFATALPCGAPDYSNIIFRGMTVHLRDDDVGPENCTAIATIKQVLPDKACHEVIRIEASDINEWAVIRGKGKNGSVVTGTVVGEEAGYIDVYVPLTLLTPS